MLILKLLSRQSIEIVNGVAAVSTTELSALFVVKLGTDHRLAGELRVVGSRLALRFELAHGVDGYEILCTILIEHVVRANNYKYATTATKACKINNRLLQKQRHRRAGW